MRDNKQGVVERREEPPGVAAARRPPAPITLAHHGAMALGPLIVEPALRRVTHDDGREEILQPRVMQVLVALAQARGEILTRDDLLASCWNGVVVGEDALNRVIGQLRRICEQLSGGALRIETITKVGYRLVGGAPAQAPDRGAGPEAGAEGEPLLAVLAFDNLSGDADFRYFSDGISEEILVTLARTTGLRVLGRSSSFQFRGAEKSARRLAEEFGASHVLDGAVRRSGDSLRISIELVDCATQTRLWSHRFDRQLADVFALQDEIAARVAEALQARFAPSASIGPIDPIAYDLYLRARDRGPGFVAFDISLLERATELAPQFAQAWGLLAFEHSLLLRWLERDAALADAQRGVAAEAAGRALALDPATGSAYLALEMLEPLCGAYDRRLALAEKALAQSPSDVLSLVHIGGLHDILGYQRLAHGYIARAYRLDPRYASFYYPYALEAAGLPQQARAVLDRDLARWPDALALRAVSLRFAGEAGDWERFDREMADLPEGTPDVPREPLVDMLAGMAAGMRNWSPAVGERMLGGLRQTLAATGTVPLSGLGFPARQGLCDQIFEILELASFEHLHRPDGRLFPGEVSLNILFTPMYDALRRDPRFVRLCAKLGLAQYWAATDHWPDFAAEVAPYYDLKAETLRLLGREAA